VPRRIIAVTDFDALHSRVVGNPSENSAKSEKLFFHSVSVAPTNKQDLTRVCALSWQEKRLFPFRFREPFRDGNSPAHGLRNGARGMLSRLYLLRLERYFSIISDGTSVG
jgi:hypothetical protein